MPFKFNRLTLLANIFSLQFTEISECQLSSGKHQNRIKRKKRIKTKERIKKANEQTNSETTAKKKKKKKKKNGKKSRYAVSRYAVTPLPVTRFTNNRLRTYRTSVFPLSLYRNESSIGERTLYKTLLLIRIFRKTVRQEQIQDTKSI